ncbi:MAG: Bacterial sugar transferase [Candidatus Nomurabacteria bacterium GW2011_GWA1_46_11]|uniref:Bacterial sugar transferase domain-containing protein n=2 Tax=Parcubacteria group TaxID=1794811 RepID=A0A1F8EYI9_9BACT|nr:MAG: Bacterial sugar transferase [Candidatus Nomurabacteria bacterium GW2011_GWA1_46_11]OGN05942.1 MAG: hypothetical protein A2669_01070 [Candidatus Yanofskybacteria bacterium RIFCSPHIGHO2_01_FULL_48_25b]
MKKFALFISDLILFYVSLALVLYIRSGGYSFSAALDLHLLPFSILLLVWLLVYYIDDLYEVTALKNSSFFFANLMRANVIAGLISTAFFYILPIYGITPKTNLLLFIIIFTGLEALARAAFNKAFGTAFRRNLIIVGLNSQSAELGHFIKKHPQIGYDLKYIVDLRDPSAISAAEKTLGSGLPVIHGIDHLEQILSHGALAGIVISPEAYRINEIINLLYGVLDRDIAFYNLSSFYERTTGRVPLGTINQIWFLENLSERRKKLYGLLKRAGDVSIAVLGGIIALLITPLIILAIKYDSPGPIFYKQNRVGRLGQKFMMIKFRTMIHDAEDKTGPVWAQSDDPRVTRVGRFLRQTRLDELPQLWTVLKGQMSFVGPRAERPEFHKTLQANVPFYEERYLIKPGLTGWAQINYHYGSSVEDAHKKLQYDLYYIKNRSLILDAGIMLKTIRIALQQSGR